MAVQLITAEQVADLPDGPEGFLGFERICRLELEDCLENRVRNENADRPFRLSYLTSVSAAAAEYGVDPDGTLATRSFIYEFNGESTTDFEGFEAAVRSIVTKVQIQVGRKKRAGELMLSPTDQTKIEHHVKVLRERIAAEPSLDAAKKKLLNKKLDDLLANLNGKKVDLARTMIIVGGFFTALNQAEAAIIKLPEVLGSIQKLVTQAKDYQDSLLPSPPEPMQITDRTGFTGRKETFPADLDDEIPF